MKVNRVKPIGPLCIYKIQNKRFSVKKIYVRFTVSGRGLFCNIYVRLTEQFIQKYISFSKLYMLYSRLFLSEL